MSDDNRGVSLADADLPLGNSARRGSFEGLIEAIEQTALDAGRIPELSSAAFRAGRLVREMRKREGLSQRDLAARLGLSQARISEIESGIGAQGPTWGIMERIAAACGAGLFVGPADTAALGTEPALAD